MTDSAMSPSPDLIVSFSQATELLAAYLAPLGIALPDEQAQDLWVACERRLKAVELDETLHHIHRTQARTPMQLDTLERNDIRTTLAQVLTQHDDWPTNSDVMSGQYNNFGQEIVDGMKARGYTPSPIK